jgi:DNA repair protein RadC
VVVQIRGKRDTGIGLLGEVSWGSHICLLYDNKQVLINIIVQYIQAGLAGNDSCLWITSRLPGPREASRAICQKTPTFYHSILKNQLAIVPFTDVFTNGGKPDLDAFHYLMTAQMKLALDSGYDGLRVAFDLSWVRDKEWEKLTGYVSSPLSDKGNRRMMAFYAYPLDRCGVKEFSNLISNGQYSLIANGDKLTRLGEIEGLNSKVNVDKYQRRYRSMIQGLREELHESRQKYFKTLRITFGAVIIKSLETGRFIEVNDKFCLLSGYRRDELIGHREEEYNIWPDLKGHAKFMEEIKKKHRIQKIEVIMLTKTGETRSMIGNSELINIAGEECTITYMVDVTGYNKAIEKEQAIISAAMDGFWITDIHGKFLEVNDSYCQMIGYSLEELLKMSIADIEATETSEETIDHITKIITRGSDHFKTRHRHKDGSIIDMEINVNFYDVDKGQLFVFVHDLTGNSVEGAVPNKRVSTSWRKDITRLQEKFVKEGLKDFEDRQIIELLLSLVMPARKAKQFSTVCIEKFETLGDFMEASPRELTQIGLTPACVFCVAMLHRLPTKVLQDKIREKSIYESPQDFFDYLYYSMRDLKHEVFKAIHLNSRNQIVHIVDLFEGKMDGISIDAHEIIENAIANKTKFLVFVHNHPSGDPTPSKSDKQLTRDLVFIGNILQIRVLDHIIIGENRYFSFGQEGLIEEYEMDFMNLKLTGTAEAKNRLNKIRFTGTK